MENNPAPHRKRQSSSKRFTRTSVSVPLPIVAALVIVTAFAASGVTYALTGGADSSKAPLDEVLASVREAPTATPTTVAPSATISPTLPAASSATAAPALADTATPAPATAPLPTAPALPSSTPASPTPAVASPRTVQTGSALPIPADGKITASGVYTGSISSATGDCVEVTADDVTISGSHIGPCNGRGIYVDGVDNFQLLDSTVDNNRSGACCERYTTVLASDASNLTIRGNKLLRGESLIELIDVRGAIIDGNVGRDPKGPFPRGQFLQTQGTTSNVVFAGNVYTCTPSNGCVQEDAVNLYRGSNITIEGNYLDSGGGLGRSSGCGIITEGIATATIRNNTLRNQYFGSAAKPRGGCGIGVASGTNILVEGNDVAGYGNVGVYVADFSGWSGGCSGVQVVGNVAAAGVNGDDNPYTTSPNCSNVSQHGNSWQLD
jgi:Right handed beta helix region